MTADMDPILSRMMRAEYFPEKSYCNHMIFIIYPFVHVYFLKTWADGYFLFL